MCNEYAIYSLNTFYIIKINLGRYNYHRSVIYNTNVASELIYLYINNIWNKKLLSRFIGEGYNQTLSKCYPTICSKLCLKPGIIVWHISIYTKRTSLNTNGLTLRIFSLNIDE